MKACMIVQEHYPKDVRVRKEAQSLVARGHKVWVIALRADEEPVQEIVNGVSVHRVGIPKRRGGILRYLIEYGVFFLAAMFRLNVLDMQEGFDVVHVNTLPDFLVFAAVVQKAKKKRIILDMHEIMPEFFMSKFRVGSEYWAVRCLQFLERVSLRFADDVITVNEPIRHIFLNRAIPDRPIAVVMNTVSATTFKAANKRAHKGFNCIYHGTISDIYGLDIALQGFANVSRRYPDLSFHIFGDGPSLPQLQDLANSLNLQGSVVFHGAVPYDTMIRRLEEMDLGILALRKDVFLNLSFSNKLAEYIFLKIPVVSSDLDTVMYYFSDDCLLYFTSGDVHDLGNKIEFAYLHQDTMRAKAEQAYKTAQPLDWDAMAKIFVSIVEQGHMQPVGEGT